MNSIKIFQQNLFSCSLIIFKQNLIEHKILMLGHQSMVYTNNLYLLHPLIKIITEGILNLTSPLISILFLGSSDYNFKTQSTYLYIF
jgi:hypothetical protein